jgi:hypothetical protein
MDQCFPDEFVGASGRKNGQGYDVDDEEYNAADTTSDFEGVQQLPEKEVW